MYNGWFSYPCNVAPQIHITALEHEEKYNNISGFKLIFSNSLIQSVFLLNKVLNLCDVRIDVTPDIYFWKYLIHIICFRTLEDVNFLQYLSQPKSQYSNSKCLLFDCQCQYVGIFSNIAISKTNCNGLQQHVSPEGLSE